MANNNAKRTTDSDRPGEPVELADVLKGRPLLRMPTPEAEAARLLRDAEEEAARLARSRLMWTLVLASSLGPRYTAERASLSSYRVYHDAQRPALATLKAFAERMEENIRESVGLVLYGWMGTGKDHLAAALLYQAARFGPARWVSGTSVFAESRDRIKQERVERELIEQLTVPLVLCISDPVPIRGDLSAWNIDLLYRVIDERYRLLKPTWMTLNAKDADDAAARLTPPVWDRLRHGAELVPCFWPTHRRERK